MIPTTRASARDSNPPPPLLPPAARRSVPDSPCLPGRAFLLCVLAVSVALLGLGPGTPLLRAQQIDFGDDSSRWALDGVCDDNRFIGEDEYLGLTADRHVGHDASDCRDLFEKGRIRVKAASPRLDARDLAPDFGDDRSIWAHDDQCDDNRFTGPEQYLGVTGDRHVRHDATDCRRLFAQGHIRLKRDSTSTAASSIYGRQDGEDGCYFNECPDDVPSRPNVPTPAGPDTNYPVPSFDFPVPNPNFRVAEACQIYYPVQFWCTVPLNSGYVGQSCWCPSPYGLVSGYAVAR